MGLGDLVFDSPVQELPPRFISIGTNCAPPLLLKYLGLREPSTPFDWNISPLSTVAAVLSGEMKNITNDMRSMNHDGGNPSADPAYYLNKPFSATSHIFFAHDGYCAQSSSLHGEASNGLRSTSFDYSTLASCPREASFHAKYSRRVARFRSSLLGEEGKYGGITYLVYQYTESTVLNQEIFPHFDLKHHRAAVDKIKFLLRSKNVRVVPMKYALNAARRECVAKLRRQRRVSLFLGHHEIVTPQGSRVILTESKDIEDAIQIISDQICGLANQAENWFHPDNESGNPT